MLSKISYAFYFNIFNNGCKGVLTEDTFPLCVVKAWRELKPLLASEPEEEDSDAVMCAICEIAEEIYRSESKQGIKSENIDGYSVTYADETSLERRIIKIAGKHLNETGLLYMGVEEC